MASPTIQYLVNRIRTHLEDRGGTWPAGFEVMVDAMIQDHVRRIAPGRAVPGAAERIRRFMVAQGGEYEGTLQEIADETGLARETVSRNIEAAGVCKAGEAGPRFQGRFPGHRYTLTSCGDDPGFGGELR